MLLLHTLLIPIPVEHPCNIEKVDHAYKSSLKEGGSQPPWAFPPQASSCPGGTLRRSPRRQLRDGPSCAPIKHGRACAYARPLKSGRTAPEANSTRRVLAAVHQLIINSSTPRMLTSWECTKASTSLYPVRDHSCQIEHTPTS